VNQYTPQLLVIEIFWAVLFCLLDEKDYGGLCHTLGHVCNFWIIKAKMSKPALIHYQKNHLRQCPKIITISSFSMQYQGNTTKWGCWERILGVDYT